MLRDLDKDTVDFGPNYDGSHAGAARPAGAVPEPARQRLVRHRRRHGDEHPAAQPARGRSTRSIAYIDDPDDRRRGADAPHQGPGLPDRRHHPRPAGHPRRLRDRPRPRARARARAHRAARSRARRRSSSPSCPTRSRRAARAGLIQKIADLVHDKKIPEITDLRDESDRTDAPGHRAQARRDPEGRAEPALQAHADADDVRRQHGRARRRRAADAVAARGDRSLRRAPARGRRPPRQARAAPKEARAHILEGLLIALDNLDAVIELIRASRDRETARDGLMTRFELSRDPGAARSSTCASRS